MVGLVAGLFLGLIGMQVDGLAEGLLGGVSWGFAFVLIFLTMGIGVGLIWGSMSGLMGGVAMGLKGPHIQKKSFPNQGIWRSAVNAGKLVLIGVSISGLLLFAPAFFGPAFLETVDPKFLGLMMWAVPYIGVEFAAVFGLSTALMREKPNQGGGQLVANAGKLILIMVIFLGLRHWLGSLILGPSILNASQVVSNPEDGLEHIASSLNETNLPLASLLPGIRNGLLIGLVAGAACIQHFVTERCFLQKVGGGYIFVHRLLLEHFAARRVRSLSQAYPTLRER
ncbi:MAG: hypothetical protein BRC48_13035 [Cyanobacteria bacterium QS_9_48_30]|nr:MAG: hypothetical protein BRC48_13035 [Cyanobacteria bacterium QS_9_48_30]